MPIPPFKDGRFKLKSDKEPAFPASEIKQNAADAEAIGAVSDDNAREREEIIGIIFEARRKGKNDVADEAMAALQELNVEGRRLGGSSLAPPRGMRAEEAPMERDLSRPETWLTPDEEIAARQAQRTKRTRSVGMVDLGNEELDRRLMREMSGPPVEPKSILGPPSKPAPMKAMEQEQMFAAGDYAGLQREGYNPLKTRVLGETFVDTSFFPGVGKYLPGPGASEIQAEAAKRGLPPFGEPSGTEQVLATGAGLVNPLNVVGKVGKVAKMGAEALPFVKAAPRLTAPLVGVAQGGAEGLAYSGGGEAIKKLEGREADLGNIATDTGISAAIGGGTNFLATLGGMLRNTPEREFIESRGGKVTPFSAGKGAPFERPEVAVGLEKSRVTGLPVATERGHGRVGRTAGEKAAEFFEGREEGVRKRLAEELGSVSEKARTPNEEAQGLYDMAVKMEADKDLYPAAFRNKVRSEIIDQLEPHINIVGDDLKIQITPEKLNKIKRKIARFENWGDTGIGDPDWAPLGAEARKGLAETEIGAANARATAERENLERARRAFDITGSATDEFTNAQERAIGIRAGRMGKEGRQAGTDLGLKGEAEQAWARENYPELGEIYDAPALIEARKRLQYGLGGGDLLQRQPFDAVKRSIMPITSRIVGPALQQAERPNPFSLYLLGEALRGRPRNERQ